MKYFNYLIIIFCFSYLSSCGRGMAQSKQQSTREFLYKTKFDTSRDNYGMHIEIKQILPKTKELIPMSIDDRDIISRSKYTRNDIIKILGEYLTFRGDTGISNKRYRFKPASHLMRPEGVKGFTLQIEALYSFTRMLTVGSAPIEPVLINCETGEELNTDQLAVNEVYDIFQKWYKENLKEGFKRIAFPLSGTIYCWKGMEENINSYLKDSL